MKDYSVLDGTKRDQNSKLNLAYDRGYDKGFEDGKYEEYKRIKEYTNNAFRQGYQEAESESNKGYQRGLDDSWECARKICTNWCVSDEMLADIFGKGETIDNIMQKYTASEAIEKIKAYEEKQKEPEFAVGDEVIWNYNGGKGIVTCLRGQNSDLSLDFICENGEVCSGRNPKWAKKTGRHFDLIETVLEAMQEGKE